MFRNPSAISLRTSFSRFDSCAGGACVDSLAYISVENLKAAIAADGGFCDACFTGDYPTAVPTSTPVLFSTPEKPVAYQAALPGV